MYLVVMVGGGAILYLYSILLYGARSLYLSLCVLSLAQGFLLLAVRLHLPLPAREEGADRAVIQFPAHALHHVQTTVPHIEFIVAVVSVIEEEGERQVLQLLLDLGVHPAMRDGLPQLMLLDLLVEVCDRTRVQSK